MKIFVPYSYALVSLGLFDLKVSTHMKTENTAIKCLSILNVQNIIIDYKKCRIIPKCINYNKQHPDSYRRCQVVKKLLQKYIDEYWE